MNVTCGLLNDSAQNKRGTIFPTDWSTFAAATPDNPASQLTDFSLFVDLAGMPAGWWTAVRSDGGDIRVTDASNVELPFDLIHFDKGATTGFLAFKATKTVAGQTFRVHAGNARARARGPEHTYGQYNAYDAIFTGFWPDGGGDDRTVNLNHCTTGGTLVVGNAAGPVGNLATTYDTALQYSLANANIPAGYPHSFIGWGKRPSTIGTTSLGGIADTAFAATTAANSVYLRFIGGGLSLRSQIFDGSGVGDVAIATAGYSVDTWVHAAAVGTSLISRSCYSAGGNAGTDVTSRVLESMDFLLIGSEPYYPLGNFELFAGDISLVQLHNAARSADWIAYQASMGNQTTFWNGWT